MKAPGSRQDISHLWIEFMLTEYEQKLDPKAKIEVTNFDCTAATKPGESFNAELIKLDVQAQVTRNTKTENEEWHLVTGTEEYNLIVKLLTADPFSCELIKHLGYHIKELTMYSDVAQELNKFQEVHANNNYRLQLPKFIYGKCTKKEYVLVMENIKMIGYETNPKQNGLDVQHCKMAVEHIARLHATSYAYDQKHNFLEKFPCFAFSHDISHLFKPVVWANLENCIKFLKNKKGMEDLANKLETGKNTLPSKFSALWDDQTRHKFCCLTHGDFWNSNIMYKHGVTQDGEQSIESIQLIDWQISQWNNPVMDLHYMLNTSTTRDTRTQHTEEILRHYHSTFTAATGAMSTPVPNWNWEQFKAEYERTSLVGFLMGMCLIQGTLSKAGETINPSPSSGPTNNDCCPCGWKKKCASASAKKIIPLTFKPSMEFVMNFAVRRLLHPIGEELKEQSNAVLNDRLLGLILEAEERGILDVMNM